MINYPPREIVERLKKQYPQGTRVECGSIEDIYTTIPPGTTGTVIGVDDIGTVHIQWDNGKALGAAYGVDWIRKVKA